MKHKDTEVGMLREWKNMAYEYFKDEGLWRGLRLTIVMQ